METPVLIALIIAGVLILGLLSWIIISVLAVRAFRKAQQDIFTTAQRPFPSHIHNYTRGR